MDQQTVTETTTVWALSIEHRYGMRTSVHRTHAGAWAALVAWVDQGWEEEVARWTTDDEDHAPPTDEVARVDAYFDVVGTEGYWLGQAELED